MKYALGNMLNGAGGLNPDGLALDLQFAADKTLTARKGPTPIFTRASSGTFVGSNGLIQSAGNNVARFDHDPVTLESRGLLIEESRTNLLIQSETLTTQTRTVTAVAHTLSFYGSGTVVLSGTHSATVVGTGNYPSRRTFTFTPTAGSLTLTVTGTVQFANLEAGSFATSYIPTTTASVVRSVDVCSITGANFTSSNFFNPSEGTIIVIGSLNTTNINSAPEVFKFNDGTNNNRIQIGMTNVSGEGVRPFIVASGATTYTSTVGTATIGVQRKIGTAYASNDAISVFNGTLGTQDTTITVPTGINQALIGISTFTGTISSIRYYKKRLANAKLVTLTT